ncbi:MAG TPA: BlaI/MecI/CopY family transcriptional regulator [Chthonomonadaceae bacterium]|nr:BlaI/MecI/CopY family transcriptional regulator [Chthonomonadaceae bacterium]
MREERALPNPTPAELDILRVLWRQGPSTVREVYEAMQRDRNTGYTTILKFLQIMTEKGLVTREEQGRAHLYSTRLTEEQAQRRMLDDLVDRAFDGAAQKLVMQALAAHKASPDELAEIRRLLDRLEEEDR